MSTATKTCWGVLTSIQSVASCHKQSSKDVFRMQKVCLAVMATLFICSTVIYCAGIHVVKTTSLLCHCKIDSNLDECHEVCEISRKLARNNISTTLTSTPTSFKPATTLPADRKPTGKPEDSGKVEVEPSSHMSSTTLPTSTKPSLLSKTLSSTTMPGSVPNHTAYPHPGVTIRTTTTGPEMVFNMNNCKSCLAGKALIAVQKGWICGGTRLGNKMYMMAAAIGAAAAQDKIYVMVKKDKDCGWIELLQELFVAFNTSIPILPYSMMQHWENFGESGFTNYDAISTKQKNFTIAGYRQTWRYFSSSVQKKAVRDAFNFTDKYIVYARDMVKKAKDSFPEVKDPLVVGLHMRIGDLVGNSYGYQMANKTFYDNVLKVVKSYFNNSESIIFIAASDSPDLGKRMLEDASAMYNIFWLYGTAFEDFATLSSCDHSIMSGGTYGFWTGWLTPGKTFYFNNFAKPGSPFASGFNNKNFHDPSWIPVSWR